MIKEIRAKSILNRSSIGDYCINPYIGCTHACIYCYAHYYTKLRGYSEPWGSYIYVKVNAPDLLSREIRRKKRGVVYLSSLTDPYQNIESRYELTRKILDILMRNGWPVIIQTKSPLVLRDIDIIGNMEANVGFTIITLDENLRKLFEPHAPPVSDRIDALMKLKEEGIRTFTFIGPILPKMSVRELINIVEEVKDYADVIYFDRLNFKPGIFNRIDRAFSEIGLAGWSTNLEAYYKRIKESLKEYLRERKINSVFVY